LGESGGVSRSSGLIDLLVTGSLRSRLNGIATCRGDSCHFPVIGDGCSSDQLGGPSSLTNGSSFVRGCLGNKGVVWLRFIETIKGNCDEDAIGDDSGGISVGSSTTMGSGLYCSIDEYSRRCNPQGTKGNGGVVTRGDSIGGGLGGMGIRANGDGFTRGGDGTLGTIGGGSMTSLGKDDDGGLGMMVVVDPPVPPDRFGLGMNTGDGDLLLRIRFCPLRRVRSPSRNV